MAMGPKACLWACPRCSAASGTPAPSALEGRAGCAPSAYSPRAPRAWRRALRFALGRLGCCEGRGALARPKRLPCPQLRILGSARCLWELLPRRRERGRQGSRRRDLAVFSWQAKLAIPSAERSLRPCRALSLRACALLVRFVPYCVRPAASHACVFRHLMCARKAIRSSWQRLVAAPLCCAPS